MKKAAFHSSGRLDVEMYLNRFRLQRFVFTADSTAFDITSFTWQLIVRQNVGAQVTLINYSLGHGLSFSPYEENVLEARFEAADLTTVRIQGEGKKYWELIRTDTNEIWLSGEMYFKYGLLDSGGSDQDVTVNVSNETILVELQGIIYANSGGGGGLSPIQDYPTFETLGFPAGASAGSRYRLVFSNINTIQTIAGVDYFHNQVIELLPNGLWVSYTNNVGASS